MLGVFVVIVYLKIKQQQKENWKTVVMVEITKSCLELKVSFQAPRSCRFFNVLKKATCTKFNRGFDEMVWGIKWKQMPRTIFTILHTKQRPEALRFPWETNVPNESFKLH